MTEQDRSTDRVVVSHRDLVAAVRLVAEHPDRASILTEVAHQAARLVGAEVSAVFHANQEGELTVVASENAERIGGEEIRVPHDASAAASIRALGADRGLGACTCVPIVCPGELDGMLAVYHRAGREASPLEEDLLTAFAEHACLVLERQRTKEALELEDARRKFLERAFRELPVGLVIAEAPSGRVLIASDALGLQWRTEVELPQSIAEYTRFPLGRLDGTVGEPQEHPLVRSLLTGAIVKEEERTFVARDGVVVRVLCSSAPIRDANGKIVAAVLTCSDVTERMRSRDAILESEERLRLLVQDVKDYAIYMLDPLGHVISWNLGAERITGYRDSEILGRMQTVFFTQEDVLVGKPDQPLKVAAEKGRGEGEGWLLRKDGSRFWGRKTITAMRDPRGSLRGFSVVLQDATERKLIEEALLESNRRNASILESISEAFFAISRDLRFTFINREAERLLGRTRADLIGRTLGEGLPDLMATRFSSDLQRALNQGETVAFEDEYPSLQKSLEVRVYPSDAGLSIYLRDITSRRQWALAQRILADAGRRVAESLDSAATLETVAHIGVPDLADACVVLVPDFNGVGYQSALGHPDAGLEAAWKEHFARQPLDLGAQGAPFGLYKVFETGQSELVPECNDEFRIAVARDSEHLELLRRLAPTSYMAVPLRGRGRTLGVLGFVSQTLSRRYTPADLQLAEEIGRIAAFAIDNARLYREAQVAIQAREDVVSIASHDIKVPLQTMLVRVQMLLRSARPAVERSAPTPNLVEGLEEIESQVDRLAKLTDVLLDISRIASGKLELEPDEVDAIEIVRGAAAQLAEQAAKAGSRIDLEFGGPIIGCWDRTRFEQIVNNLLSNAIRYGEGKPIDIAIDADEHVARIRIRDRGPGIPPERRELIFQRFQRGGRLETGRFGLGLWITRQIVERFGGKIEVDEAPDGGAIFSVELPRQLLQGRPHPGALGKAA